MVQFANSVDTVEVAYNDHLDQHCLPSCLYILIMIYHISSVYKTDFFFLSKTIPKI